MPPHRLSIPELLAPAGDTASLHAALNAGCNAVYLGSKAFSMRNATANFTPDGCKKAFDLCHEKGARLYVTVNTIVYDRELTALYRLLDKLADRTDAVICWDFSVMAACRERGIPFHISTQASVSNTAAAKFYRDFGASRIVLARECTLKEIKAIAKNAGIGLEVFAHGAMCVSESGRCYLSQDTYGSSGNRGRCFQNCRRPYRVICQDGPGDFEVTPGDNHVFSAKDLCTLPFLDKILETGVVSLKIEGRNRAPDYVDTVVRAYRTAIDAWMENALTQQLKESLTETCRKVFNRDFSSGFYLGRPIAEFTECENNAATEKKTFLGKVINYYPKSGVAYIALQNGTVANGDSIVVIGPTTGALRMTVTDPRIENTLVGKAFQTTATFKTPEKVRQNDAVYKLTPCSRKTQENNG